MSEPKTWNENMAYPSEPEPYHPHVKINGNGNSTSTSFSWSNITKNIPEGLLLGIALCLVIIESAALFFEWRHRAQQSELQRYELSDFQTTHFNPLAAQVKSDHDLIQAYGLQKLVATTCRSN